MRVWNGFLLGKARKEEVPCRFCGGRDRDGHLFWECTFPEFMSLTAVDRWKWPRCLLWHGWLPGLVLLVVGILGLPLLSS